MAPTTIDEIIERLREKDREPNDPVLGAILYLYYRTSNGESMGARLLRELLRARHRRGGLRGRQGWPES